MTGEAVPDNLTREEIFEQALRIILFKAHKRKMLKSPPPKEEWWGFIMSSPIELVDIIEQMGDIAYKALADGDKQI
jgi:hypothetical protein